MSRIRIALALMGVAAAIAAAGCSSHPKGAGVRLTPPGTKATAPGAGASSSAPAPAPPTSAATVTAAGLSGTWAGQYSGAYQGTFTLRWHQSGSRLTGRITLSDPSNTLPIHGTVSGGAIKFGTVGSVGITYTGTVSGNSMSGSYQVHAAGGAIGGPWSASKKS